MAVDAGRRRSPSPRLRVPRIDEPARRVAYTRGTCRPLEKAASTNPRPRDVNLDRIAIVVSTRRSTQELPNSSGARRSKTAYFQAIHEDFGLNSRGIALASAGVLLEVTMLVLKRAQRAVFVEKLPDAANLALGALVFGQFLSDRFYPWVALLGLTLWIFFIGCAVIVAGGAR